MLVAKFSAVIGVEDAAGAKLHEDAADVVHNRLGLFFLKCSQVHKFREVVLYFLENLLILLLKINLHHKNPSKRTILLRLHVNEIGLIALCIVCLQNRFGDLALLDSCFFELAIGARLQIKWNFSEINTKLFYFID